MKKKSNRRLVKKKEQALEKVFRPTKKMRDWLNATIDLGYGATVVDVAKKSNASRESWYSWLNKPGFMEWWDEQWEKYTYSSRWRLDAIGFKLAAKNHDYWRDMMTRTGIMQSQQSHSPVSVNQFQMNVDAGTAKKKFEKFVEGENAKKE